MTLVTNILITSLLSNKTVRKIPIFTQPFCWRKYALKEAVTDVGKGMFGNYTKNTLPLQRQICHHIIKASCLNYFC